MTISEQIQFISKHFDIITISTYSDPCVIINLDIIEPKNKNHMKITKAHQDRRKKVIKVNYEMPFSFRTLEDGLAWIINYCNTNFKK